MDVWLAILMENCNIVEIQAFRDSEDAFSQGAHWYESKTNFDFTGQIYRNRGQSSETDFDQIINYLRMNNINLPFSVHIEAVTVS